MWYTLSVHYILHMIQNSLFFPYKKFEGVCDDHCLSHEPCTEWGTSSWDLIPWPLPFAPWPAAPDNQASDGHSFFLTFELLLVGVHRVEAAQSTSEKEKTTLSAHPTAGSKMQELLQIVLSPWLLKAEQWEERSARGKAGFVCIWEQDQTISGPCPAQLVGHCLDGAQ